MKQENNLRIWHISDTHGNHESLVEPEGIDIVIFSGDSSNAKVQHINHEEVYSFLVWFGNLNIEHKIYVAGNHDVSIEKGSIKESFFSDRGITYLENNFTIINGYKIFGSPFTPSFGSWSFMKDRSKINRLWENIPYDIDVMVGHGMPKGILDTTFNANHDLLLVGDSALRKKLNKIEGLLLYCGGHIHNCREVSSNAGILRLSGSKVAYSNGSCVTDGRIKQLSSNGNVLELPLK